MIVAIRFLISVIGTFGLVTLIYRLVNRLRIEIDIKEKNRKLFDTACKWLQNKQNRKEIGDLLRNEKINNVAIYGMGALGELLAEELLSCDLNVKYGIDRNMENLISVIPLVSLDDAWENVDAIIVTAVTSFDEIADYIEDKIHCKVFSLEDIVFKLNWGEKNK